jgi:hypothetical protein
LATSELSPPSPSLLPWRWSRQRLAALGLLLAALGVAHRLAFVVTPEGAVLVIAGTLLLLAAALVPGLPQASDRESNLTFTALFLVLALATALSPYSDDAWATLLTAAAAIAFVVLEAVPRARQARLYVVAGLVLAAHSLLVMHMDFPKQDVFRFLTYGVDGFFHHGINPYLPIPDPRSSDVLPYAFTYPPGALLVVAPFRLLLGDVRWAFVAGEMIFVVAAAATARRRVGLATWQQALLLTPLVLPRASQAYFDFGNHDWVLLGLAAAAVALRRSWLWSGLLLGVGIATKQYFVIFPVAFLLPWLSRAALVTSALTAVALVTPFAAWDWGRFSRDLSDPLRWPPPNGDRLTLVTMIQQLGVDIGRIGATLLAGTGLLLAGISAWLGRVSLARALMACGASLALFNLLSSYAAYNYYAYALALFAWGAAISGADAEGRA